MKKNIRFEDIKQFFVELADGKHKKIQIEQLVINEMIFVDKSREPYESHFLYESISFAGTFLSWIAIMCVSYSLYLA